MTIFKRTLPFFTLLLLLTVACCRQESVQLRLALSKGSPDSLYINYYNWVQRLDSTAVCIDMYAMRFDSAMELFRSCHGLILTGGTDVHPGFYGKAYDTVRCWPIDDHRDRLEMALIDSALAWGLPVLGICRGHQMLNVALGGSLIVDIPSDFDTLVRHQCGDYLSCTHPVHIDTTSLLFQISGIRYGSVNSNHHQAADRVAMPLQAVAFTDDGLIEALEWKNREGKPFLLGVQWHPERMEITNPLSGEIGRRFLEEVDGRRSAVRSQRPPTTSSAPALAH
ncbi:MAG: gamma-glutamyl-gamma-aminobutyrate hydrolase family protein [Bacteroidales bacterium]|nr:gamma-glutamyl-gamma-aminobutyrate hydrolase family protein [Bacteroidales bacterium]